MYTVKEAFSTPSRRFAPGDKVDRADLVGPVPVKTWVDLGRIEVLASETAPTQAPKARKAAEISASA
ncbi:hypothetical protein IP70_15665 [alpha proteobacterium AAP38]|nr:hypothetical protein IP70_15665 [alpha proteobacterium AAP38]